MTKDEIEYIKTMAECKHLDNFFRMLMVLGGLAVISFVGLGIAFG